MKLCLKRKRKRSSRKNRRRGSRIFPLQIQRSKLLVKIGDKNDSRTLRKKRCHPLSISVVTTL